jgi:hypothetical protein
MKELLVCRKELDIPHINGSQHKVDEKIMFIVDGEKGFINPLAYETQIVKRLNSLQSH